MNNHVDHQLSSSKHHLRSSVFLVVFRIFMTLFTVNTVYAALIVLALYSDITTVYGNALVFGGLWAVHTAQFILETAMIIFIIVHWVTDEYYITDRQLFHYQGLWHMDERIYELQHIKSVKLYQTFFGRIFHYGTITLMLGARGYSETLKLRECADPKKYERLFRSFVQA